MSDSCIDDDTLLRPSRRLLASMLGEEVVILQPERGRYYGVAGVGAVLWQLLEGAPRTLGALVSSQYDVSEVACRRDVAAFVADLLGEGLLEAVVLRAHP